ncbi:MAG: 2-iminoacetate synthase ThiH, partial [Bacteroidales bacterium]|nr:2-iminoacetate synthase ThiH [Bacteroidales bacterium]
MEFYDTINNLVWDDVTRSVYEKTDADVRRALAKETLTIEDFKALISPAAENYLERMAQLSRHYTQQRFGKVILLDRPMYLSNECSNHCIYCGFNHNNDIARK